MAESIGAFLEELGDAFRAGWQRAEARHEFKRLWHAVRIRGSGWDRELAEIRERYDAVKRRHDASSFADSECPQKLVIPCLHEIFDACPGALPLDPIIDAVTSATLELLSDEIFFGFPHIDWDVPLSLDEGMALKRYLEQGFLALDNNLSERTLRAIALGRNAWGVIGSEVGGQTAAVLYSVVGTCKHLVHRPYRFPDMSMCCTRWSGRASTWGWTRLRTCVRRCQGCSRRARSRQRSSCWIGSRTAGC